MNRSRKIHVGLAITPVIVALFLRLFVIFHYGPNVSIHSDDMGYLRSAEWLLQDGTYSYYTPNAPTVHMLPGMTFILAAVIGIFGHGSAGLYVAKVLFACIGTAGIVGAYKAVEHIWNRWAALLVGLFMAVYVPGVEVDTLFLTEPPFMAAFAWTIYFLVKAADSHKLRHIAAASVLFMVSVYFRPNVLLWAVVALIYLLIKRYPAMLLLRHGAVAIAIVLICIAPWWIRNAIVFHQFIPLTDDAANPLLLGTFQGLHYPAPYSPSKVEHSILVKHPGLRPQADHELAWFHQQQKIAIYRIRHWHYLHPRDFWQSYLWIKPGILWNRAYYPIRILGVLPSTLKAIQPWLIWISIAGHATALIFAHGRRKEAAMIALSLLYFTGLFSVFFAYERYNVPLMWLMVTGVAGGLWALWDFGRRIRKRWG